MLCRPCTLPISRTGSETVMHPWLQPRREIAGRRSDNCCKDYQTNVNSKETLTTTGTAFRSPTTTTTTTVTKGRIVFFVSHRTALPSLSVLLILSLPICADSRTFSTCKPWGVLAGTHVTSHHANVTSHRAPSCYDILPLTQPQGTLSDTLSNHSRPGRC